MSLARSLGLAIVLFASTATAAPPGSEFDGPEERDVALDRGARWSARAAEAEAWRAALESGTRLQTCYSAAVVTQRGPALRAAIAEVAAARKGYATAESASAPAPSEAEMADARSAVEAASRTTDARRAEVERARAAVDRSGEAARRPGATAADRQRSEEARAELAAAELGLAEAEATKAERQKALTALEAAAKARADAEKEVAAAAARVEAAIASFERTADGLASSIDDTTFSTIANDAARVKACADLHRELLSAVDANGARRVEALSKVDAKEAHATDILRKGPTLGSDLEGTTGILEKPGSPDRIALALMSGLGAESRTDGTRVVTTLSLSSLFWPNDEERLKLGAGLRHLFLQANLPVQSTEEVAAAGDQPSGAAPEVVRFSFKLGGSFTDETDTRLPTHVDCYRATWMVVRSANAVSEADARTAERAKLIDACNRVAAHRQRLAWRAGLGFLTEDGNTRVEKLVGGLVWGPTSYLFMNGVYQRLEEPEVRNAFGGGLSFSTNIGGPGTAGVDAWSRVGLDLLVLGVHDDGDDDVDVEIRVTPTLRAKVLGNAIATVGVGPRVLGNRLDDGDAELLATVGLTWDADALVDGLLDPSVPPTKE